MIKAIRCPSRPPELASDIDQGIIMTGGSSMLRICRSLFIAELGFVLPKMHHLRREGTVRARAPDIYKRSIATKR